MRLHRRHNAEPGRLGLFDAGQQLLGAPVSSMSLDSCALRAKPSPSSVSRGTRSAVGDSRTEVDLCRCIRDVGASRPQRRSTRAGVALPRTQQVGEAVSADENPAATAARTERSLPIVIALQGDPSELRGIAPQCDPRSRMRALEFGTPRYGKPERNVESFEMQSVVIAPFVMRLSSASITSFAGARPFRKAVSADRSTVRMSGSRTSASASARAWLLPRARSVFTISPRHRFCVLLRLSCVELVLEVADGRRAGLERVRRDEHGQDRRPAHAIDLLIVDDRASPDTDRTGPEHARRQLDHDRGGVQAEEEVRIARLAEVGPTVEASEVEEERVVTQPRERLHVRVLDDLVRRAPRDQVAFLAPDHVDVVGLLPPPEPLNCTRTMASCLASPFVSIRNS